MLETLSCSLCCVTPTRSHQDGGPAYLTELASECFARYTRGVGSRPISEEALLKVQERNNYARLDELAAVVLPSNYTVVLE